MSELESQLYGSCCGESQVKMADKHKRGDLEGEELKQDHLNHAKLLYESSGTNPEQVESEASNPLCTAVLTGCQADTGPHRDRQTGAHTPLSDR